VSGIPDVEGLKSLSGRSVCLSIQGYLSDSDDSSFSFTLEGLAWKDLMSLVMSINGSVDLQLAMPVHVS
jgi:hypothetical protein